MRPIILAVALILCFSGAIARDAPARVVWENTTFMPQASQSPLLFAIGPTGLVYQASTGGTYVPGQPSYTEINVRAFDSLGRVSWSAIYHRPPMPGDQNRDDMASAIAATGAGIIVAGTSDSGNLSVGGTGDDWVTVRYSANGEVLWIRRLDGGGSDWAYDMAINRSGSVVIGGFIGDTAHTPQTPHLVKYSPAGDTLWGATVPVEPNASARVERVAMDGRDNVYTGTAQVRLRRDHTQWDVLIDKYSPDGAQLWRRQRANEIVSEYLTALKVDRAGNVFARGVSLYFTAYLYGWFEKYSPEGELLWAKDFTNASLNQNVQAHDETRQKLYVLGTVEGVPLTLLQVDANTGDWGWRAQVPLRPPNGAIGGIVIDSHGNIIVLGRTIKGRRYWAEDIRFTLTKFTPEGRELWTYTHPTNWRRPGPWSLEIDADDNIFVWGIEVAKLQMLPVRSEGDLNNDRVVDDADLMEVLANQGANTFAGDVNEDGAVDVTDFEIVMEYYGMGARE